MPDETVTIELLARLGRQTLQEMRVLRNDVANARTLSLQTIDYARRIERRIGEVEHRMGAVEHRMGEMRDDLELMIKAELGGALANMQTELENHVRPLQDRFLELDKLEERVSALERRT